MQKKLYKQKRDWSKLLDESWDGETWDINFYEREVQFHIYDDTYEGYSFDEFCNPGIFALLNRNL